MGIAFLFSFFSLRYVRERIDSNSWPNILAKVSDIVVKKHSGGEGSPAYWNVYIQLQYVVNGVTYTKLKNTRITKTARGKFFNKDGATKEEMNEKGLEQYPLGSDFELYYNPKKPKKTLERIGLTEFSGMLGKFW